MTPMEAAVCAAKKVKMQIRLTSGNKPDDGIQNWEEILSAAFAAYLSCKEEI